MTEITLQEAREQLAEWKAASLRIAKYGAASISTSAGSRSLTQQSATEVRNMIDYWQRKVNELSAEADCGESRFSLANFNNRY